MNTSLEISSGFPFIDLESQKVTPTQNTGTTNVISVYEFLDPDDSSGCALWFSGRILDDISINPGNNPSIESVIAVSGYPDFVEPLPCRGSCTYFLTWKEERNAI